VLLVLLLMARAWMSETAQSSDSDTGVTTASGAGLNGHRRGPEQSENLVTMAILDSTDRLRPLLQCEHHCEDPVSQ
jgi:hypothetical protein